MKIVLLLFWLLLLNTFAFGQHRNKIPVETVKIDSAVYKLQNVLIMGSGSVSTRIFLDNLTEELSWKLSSDTIKSTYLYGGKTLEEAQQKYDKLSNEEFQFLLVFFPGDKGSLKINRDQKTYPFSLPNRGTFNPIIKNDNIIYEENFIAQLYLIEKTPKILWTTSFSIFEDIRSKKLYDQVSSTIYNSFKEYGYLN